LQVVKLDYLFEARRSFGFIGDDRAVAVNGFEAFAKKDLSAPYSSKVRPREKSGRPRAWLKMLDELDQTAHLQPDARESLPASRLARNVPQTVQSAAHLGIAFSASKVA
jgi:hypothetical protein